MRLNEFDTFKSKALSPEQFANFLGQQDLLFPARPKDMWKQIKWFIRDNCKTILSVYKINQNFLYSGFRDNSPPIFFSKSPTNRKPQDTALEIQQAVDNNLKHVGFSALRNNSLFTTGSLSMAKNYGRAYIIFPLDGFSFTWSPKIVDMYHTSRMSINSLLLAGQFEEYSFVDSLKLSPEKFVNAWSFKTDNLIEAINSGNEILICGKYIALKSDCAYLKYILS